MDLGPEGWGEAQRVFSHSENICLEKSVFRNSAKSVNTCHIRLVVLGIGIKLRSVHLLKLVAIINMKSRS